MSGLHPLVIFVLMLISVAAVIDIHSHRLPNLLTVSGAVVGILLQLVSNGNSGLIDGVLGLVAAFMLFLPFYLVRWMGAGDVKLLMSVGACIGWPLILPTAIATLAIGVCFALILMTWRGGLRMYLGRYISMLKWWGMTRQWQYLEPEEGEAATIRFPYGFAIALGTFAALVYSGKLPLPM